MVARELGELRERGGAGGADGAGGAGGRGEGRGPLRSEDVTPLLLELLGVTEAGWEAGHEVAALHDTPSVGPTRNLDHEW